MKILSVVGARPQFIKASVLSRCILKNYSTSINEIIVHTGQHFDDKMSSIFFDELNIPKPAYNLSISAMSHGAMTGRMIEALENVMIIEKPSRVLVYGDTNSTLAAAVAASKLNVPIDHVEAGLRSYNNQMPEEINRILTDRISSLLFCPTAESVKNLQNEGITKGVHQVGDIMFDAALNYAELAYAKSTIIHDESLATGDYVLVTCHRAENTDNVENLQSIFAVLSKIAEERQVIFPMHPRTRQAVIKYGLEGRLKNINVIDPVSFLDMVALEKSAKLIITDSGGVQKEAYFYQVPCITLRNETEWVETVSLGWNQLVGTDPSKIYQAYRQVCKGIQDQFPYGNGRCAYGILETMLSAG